MAAESDRGSINGVWKLQMKVASQYGIAQFNVSAGGRPVREPLAVWVQ